MKRNAIRTLAGVASAIAVTMAATGVSAQSNRPVTVVVKNTAGAGGTLGVGEVARARADGRTLGMAPVGPLTTQPHLRALPYNIDSFDYICLAYSAPTVIAVAKDAPFSTLEEMVSHAKANPGEVTFAVQAIGSVPHIAGLALAEAAGIEMTYLPVNGDGPALKALLQQQRRTAEVAGDAAIRTAEGTTRSRHGGRTGI